ncbi:MAG: phosphotransferase family protein [Caulobacterales bacterium]
MASVDTEPKLATLLEAREARRALPAYTPKPDAEVAAALEQFFRTVAPNSAVSGVARIGGGASKEMFVFTLETPGEGAQRYILCMDPLVAVTETDRKREAEAMAAFQGIVPAPRPAWVACNGEILGQPAVIMELVSGVTKPSGGATKVSGLGTYLGPRLRELLRGQFLDNLIKIHAFDWRDANFQNFDFPLSDPKQAARWQVGYWAELWRQDADHASPIMVVAERWLRENLPSCDELVFVHADYRTGNYLFDEASGRMTAMLDWELSYVGDFHDDLAWILTPLFGTYEDGVFRASDLYEREEFIEAYEQRTGRSVNRRTLHFYEVFAAYKCYVITAASGMGAARTAHNHQDILLTFLSGASPMFRADLCRLLSQRDFA